MNLANKITIARMILVPIMVIIPFFNIDTIVLGIPLSCIIIAAIFIIAALTDKLDGYIARSRNQVTNFGKFLDPIADKILVIAAMIMLVEMNRLPTWIPVIVIIREFAVSGYRLIALEQGGGVIAANKWGKIKTVTQVIAIALAFIDIYPYGYMFTGDIQGFSLVLNSLTTIIMTISVIATIFSGWSYIKGGKDLLKNN